MAKKPVYRRCHCLQKCEYMCGLLYIFCFDLTTYKNTYQSEVGVPFKNAVTVAASNIIEYLALTPIPKTAIDGQRVAANLKIQSTQLSDDLSLASTSSDGLRLQLDHEFEDLVAQGSTVEKQIADAEKQLQQVSGQIQTTISQVTEAQNQVNVAQRSVQDAEEALREADRRVSKAKHCLFGLCRIFNGGGIRHAHQDRDRARSDLNGRQQRLAQYQTQLGQLQQLEANLMQTKTGFETTKNQLNVQLGQLKQTSTNVNIVDVQLKAVIVHIGTLYGKSQVLVDVVKNLIDMETVIGPLTAISNQIIGFTPNGADVAYLNAMKQKIAANLPLVQLKLVKYALIPPND